MIFSYYQNINQVYTRQSPEQDILVIKDKIKKETESVSLPKSQQCQNLKDRFNWIKKKYAEFSELNKFSLVKASSSLNFINQETSKFFMKSKKIINPEQTQNNTNGQEKKKRFFSESEVFEQKKIKSQNNKLFNSTLIDGEHNFVGKNYQKQVDIIKLSSNQLRTLSPKRIYLSKKEKVQEKQKTSSYQFGQNDTDKFHLVKCQINSLRKRLSLNEKSFQQRSSQQKQARCHKLSTSLCIADEIKKQHKKAVENHIKAEIKRLRKEKLNKFRLKDCHKKNQNKASPSSKTVYSGKSKYQSPLKVSAMNSSLAEMLNSKISDKMKMKIEHYESIICPDKRITRPIFEFNISDELKPWESQNMEFMELK